MAQSSDRVVRMVWVLAAAVSAFTIENIWIDPWVARRSHHRLPSFVPDAQGTSWFLVLLMLAIGTRPSPVAHAPSETVASG